MTKTVQEEVRLFHYLDKKYENSGLSPKEYGLYISLLSKYGTYIYKM